MLQNHEIATNSFEPISIFCTDEIRYALEWSHAQAVGNDIWLTQWEEYAFSMVWMTLPEHGAQGSGRPRKTTSKQDRQIVRTVERHPQQIKQAAAALKKKDWPESSNESPPLTRGWLEL